MSPTAPGVVPSLEPQAVQDWVGEGLARFKVPAYVEFRDALPYTQTGKVMKHRLREIATP